MHAGTTRSPGRPHSIRTTAQRHIPIIADRRTAGPGWRRPPGARIAPGMDAHYLQAALPSWAVSVTSGLEWAQVIPPDMLLYVLLLFSTTAAVLSVVYLQPKHAFRLAAALFPDVLFFCPPPTQAGAPAKVVALSIDDGPTTSLTEEVLDILAEHNAKATFFLIGDYIATCNRHYKGGEGTQSLGELLLQRMRDEGHEVANHTWFDRPTVRLPLETFRTELLALDRVLFGLEHPASQPPHRIKWFRPGGGWFNRRMVKEAQKHGYRVALGCVHPFDVSFKTPGLNAWHVATRVHPGAIVVLHDGPGRDHTLPTLRRLLPTLRQQGYTVTTMSDLWHWSQTGRLVGAARDE